MPNVDIHVRPFNTPQPTARPRTVRMEGGARRSHSGLQPRDLHRWLEKVDPSQGTPGT